MEQSSLELYETAYKYHYIDNRIPDALLYYQKLIEIFPDSNECGYASIQIQKIKAENLSRELKKAGKIMHPVSMIALILGILSLLLSGSYGYLLNKKISLESHRSSLALKALGKMYRGEDDDALQVLTELKLVSNKEITPFELTADILKKRKNYKAALEEYTNFLELNPDKLPSETVSEEMQKLNKLLGFESNKIESIKKKDSSTPAKSKLKTVKSNKNKSNTTIKPDSISYF